MLVFDALIYNENRHFGKFGLIVMSSYGVPFENIVKEFITSRQKAKIT